jgi:formate hydrogenlyase subunit 6/NADH:ubiquinone oxidoreductase subunit I
VNLDSGLAIDPERCRGCLLCTTVCPVGALEQNSDFSACPVQLSRVPEPVLGCVRTKERSNSAFACLGGLSEEHLLALCHSLSGALNINLSSCAECPNSPMIPHVRQRLAVLDEAGLLEGGCAVTLVESAAELRFCDEAVGRRGFFKSLRNSLFQSAAVIVSGSTEQGERRTAYAEKRVPVRRELLNRVVGRLSPVLEKRARNRYDHLISFSGDCTACQGCVAICPTGALRSDSHEEPPRFDFGHCTGCGLCVEFCLDGAARCNDSTSFSVS